jgi:hypothetical protein
MYEAPKMCVVRIALAGLLFLWKVAMHFSKNA